MWDTGLLERLHERYQFHVCGEGGEYESLVIDSPLHKKKLVFDQVEIDESPDDDGCGNLRIPQCHAEEKGPDDVPIYDWQVKSSPIPPTPVPVATQTESRQKNELLLPTVAHLPSLRHCTGGLFQVGEIMASASALSDPSKTEADLAVLEALEVFAVLQRVLQNHDATPQDVVFVHLYLSEISHFASINAHYQAFFGSLLPPSRSCVALGKRLLPGGRRVLLDCFVQRGSGDYMRSKVPSSTSSSQSTICLLYTSPSPRD